MLTLFYNMSIRYERVIDMYKEGQRVKLLTVNKSLKPVRDYYKTGEVGIISKVTDDTVVVVFEPNSMSKNRKAFLTHEEVEIVA